MPIPKGGVGWDNLTGTQQGDLLGYYQIASHDHEEFQVSLHGGKSKPGTASK